MRAVLFAGLLLGIVSPAAAQLPVDVTSSLYRPAPQAVVEEGYYGRGPIKRVTVKVFDPDGDLAGTYSIGEGAAQQQALRANLLKRVKAAKLNWEIAEWARDGDEIDVHFDVIKPRPVIAASQRDKYAPRPPKPESATSSARGR